MRKLILAILSVAIALMAGAGDVRAGGLTLLCNPTPCPPPLGGDPTGPGQFSTPVVPIWHDDATFLAGAINLATDSQNTLAGFLGGAELLSQDAAFTEALNQTNSANGATFFFYGITSSPNFNIEIDANSLVELFVGGTDAAHLVTLVSSQDGEGAPIFLTTPIDPPIGQNFYLVDTTLGGTGHSIDAQGCDSSGLNCTALQDSLVFQVPEPASLAVFGLGLFGFARLRRRFS